ncbi:hypothetical protein Tco_1532525, partial [Tanacetum coccineum]
IEVPTYMEEGYYDSEGDILYLESLLSDDNTPNLSLDVFFDHEPQHIKNESNHDTLITFSPKNDPLHYEFAGGVITIPPGIVREHEDYINRMSLLCGNSSSRSPENFHTIIEDSDSNREEIDIFSGPDDSIPLGIESDIDSEEDIIDNLLNNDPIPEFECLTFDMEPDVPNFLQYLTYPEVSPLLSSTENEDTIFDPGIFAFHFSSQEQPGHLAARLGCAETKVATWDDLAFKLIILGWNVKHKDIESKESYDSNLDEPVLLVTPLSDANKDECFDPGGDEIDAFLDIDVSTDIEDGYHDSEGDIIYLESFLLMILYLISLLRIAPDYEDSRARGFIHRSLELLSFACLYMGIRYPRSY